MDSGGDTPVTDSGDKSCAVGHVYADMAGLAGIDEGTRGRAVADLCLGAQGADEEGLHDVGEVR